MGGYNGCLFVHVEGSPVDITRIAGERSLQYLSVWAVWWLMSILALVSDEKLSKKTSKGDNNHRNLRKMGIWGQRLLRGIEMCYLHSSW